MFRSASRDRQKTPTDTSGTFAHVLLRSWGANAVIPARVAPALTTYQTTFWVMPLPDTPPFFRIERNESPIADGSTCSPAVDRRLYPSWYGYGAHVAGFPDQVDDRPVILALLNVANVQRNDLRSTQRAAKEKRDDGAIAFLPKRVSGGSRKERFAFSGAQPVANAPTKLRHSLDTTDAGGKCCERESASVVVRPSCRIRLQHQAQTVLRRTRPAQLYRPWPAISLVPCGSCSPSPSLESFSPPLETIGSLDSPSRGV